MKAGPKAELDLPIDEPVSAPALPPFRGNRPADVKSEGLNLLKELLSNPAQHELRSEAEAFLSERARLLKESQPACRRAADAIGQEYTANIGKQGYEGLPYISINRIFREMIASLPPAVQEIWFNLHAMPEAEHSTMFKVFSWSFNRIKEKSPSVEDLQIRIKERGEIGGEPLPYPSHTHIDVPFCLRALGFTGNNLNVALAASHDSYEEGASIRKELDKINLTGIDLAQLIRRFPEGNLGRQLAIGIPALTETEYLDLIMALPNERIEAYEDFARPFYRTQLEQMPTHPAGLTKVHFQDPLVFGGLAWQVAATVRVLSKHIAASDDTSSLAKEHIRQLLHGIVEVELADRLSDISTLERHLDLPVEELAYGRFKVMAYASRMLNMHDRLKDAVAILPTADSSVFDGALKKCIAVLAYKLDEVSSILKESGTAGIEAADFDDYYRRVFSPIQRKAEEICQDFLLEKIERYLENL